MIARRTVVAYIGLGSNLGDRVSMIIQALLKLEEFSGVRVALVSQLIDTAPVGGPEDQDDYINGVAELRCELPAEELLSVLQEVESSLGRERLIKWGPRTIDLDLLLFDEEVIDTPGLQVPHPSMHERRFVMEGLVEIAPEVVHPVLGKTMQQIMDELCE